MCAVYIYIICFVGSIADHHSSKQIWHLLTAASGLQHTGDQSIKLHAKPQQ